MAVSIQVERTNFATAWLLRGDAQQQYGRGPDDIDEGWLVDTGGISSNHVFVMGPIRLKQWHGKVAGPPKANEYTVEFAVDFYYRPQGDSFGVTSVPFKNFSQLISFQPYIFDGIAAYCDTIATTLPVVGVSSAMVDYYLSDIELPKIVHADSLVWQRVWIGVRFYSTFI